MVLRIFKRIATSGFLTALECTEFVFEICPGPHWGAYSVPSDHLAGLRTPTSKGEEGEGKRREEGERKGTGWTPSPSKIPGKRSEGTIKPV